MVDTKSRSLPSYSRTTKVQEDRVVGEDLNKRSTESFDASEILQTDSSLLFSLSIYLLASVTFQNKKSTLSRNTRTCIGASLSDVSPSYTSPCGLFTVLFGSPQSLPELVLILSLERKTFTSLLIYVRYVYIH